MKRARTTLDRLIDDLLKSRILTKPGDDGGIVTAPYLRALGDILYELIELTHEGDYKGRHGIHYDIRSYTTHENGRIDQGIARLPDEATPEQIERALEDAMSNVESANRVLKQMVQGLRFRREDAEIIKAKRTNP